MKDYLEKVDYSKPENKQKMNNLFKDVMEDLKEVDEESYYDAKCKLYEIVYGKTVNDDMAERWIQRMKPLAKWTKEEVSSVAASYGLTNIPLNCAYVIMNMKYSDNSDVLGDGESEESLMNYIKETKDFYNDEDYNGTGEEKTYDYGKYVVKIWS